MTFTRTFRRFVLPTAWLLIGATIAVSLAVLAFGGGATGAEGTESPTAVSLSPTITVERATLENSLEIDGTIVIDPAVPVKASVDGTLTHVHVPNGAKVSKGDPLFEVRTVVEPEVAAEDEDDEPAPPVVRFVAVTAPATGRLAAFTGKVGDEVTGDAAMARIKRSTFTARGTVPVVDRYRLMDAPDEARVTIDGGPEPFTCTDLQIADEGVESAGGAEAPVEEGEEPESSSAAEVVCDVPEDVTVFDGLELSMSIDAGSAQDALVVPVTAVRGLLKRGTVWVVDDSGKQTERRVRLGVNDGKSVEILKGLEEGAQILQYVPGSPTDGDVGGESEAGY
ncbi:efflux RND transporter periplasmic adaptor subunit [Aeromicrobium flavum]|uniref:efflux RND transporter periplasmic adaptor subunit n=1 Tax=Aeromicrobium flavum TaxID=416568 RepID=UPI001649DCC5|nr:biotin/lipoyl-binding protein [Aeromicrobium flavum]